MAPDLLKIQQNLSFSGVLNNEFNRPSNAVDVTAL